MVLEVVSEVVAVVPFGVVALAVVGEAVPRRGEVGVRLAVVEVIEVVAAVVSVAVVAAVALVAAAAVIEVGDVVASAGVEVDGIDDR